MIARAPELRSHLLVADLDLDQVAGSSARRLFLPDRRPELYPGWIGGSQEPAAWDRKVR